MNRYKDIELPIHNIDISHFTIFLHFEGVIRPLSVSITNIKFLILALFIISNYI